MMAELNSRYVDPDTGSWALDEYKDFRRVGAALGMVYGSLMTQRGSIEERPDFGSRLHLITHLAPGVTDQIKSAIDEVMRPMVGTWFDSYTRNVWLQGGAPIMAIEIKRSGATEAVEIPLSAVE